MNFIHLAFLALMLICECSNVVADSHKSWLYNSTLYKETQNTVKYPVPKFQLNLDLPPSERWRHIASLPRFRDASKESIEYLESMVPRWLVPIIETIGKDIEPYFGWELSQEMTSLAQTVGPPLKVGHLVALNLVMQLEYIGLNCSTWNNTGPTVPNDPGCMAIDPTQEWCYCKEHPHGVFSTSLARKLRNDPYDGPGLCTSLIAEDGKGRIFHGRNLDWNIPPALRKLVIDVDFQKRGKTLFTATSVLGFVGVFNGVKKGSFSVSINARGKGGTIVDNLLQSLAHKSKTPSQHLRSVFSNEKINDFASAIEALSQGAQIDENYYIVGGVNPGEGAVIARGRNRAVAVQYMRETPDSWFILETNYDYWNPIPQADDRRAPGMKYMRSLKPEGVKNGSGILENVISLWPVFNHHTDYSAIMSAGNETYTYQSFVWLPSK